MKRIVIFTVFLSFAMTMKAQPFNCTFKEPDVVIHFGTGEVPEMNLMESRTYDRIRWSCPSDGYYTYTSYTSDCFGGDWHTLEEDHTPGDVNGNMMLVNASYTRGTFFMTPIRGLKPSTTYEFGVWMMNVCRPTEKCPYPLLPDIDIRLQTVEGKAVMQLSTGRVSRKQSPEWTQYTFLFTSPADVSTLVLSMVNYSPGGCGNDFALDDITFRECVKTNTIGLYTPVPKKQSNKSTVTTKPAAPQKKAATPPARKPPVAKTTTPQKKAPVTKAETPVTKPSVKPQTATVEPVQRELKRKVTVAPPPVLRSRQNALMKKLSVGPGEIRIDLYDNGQIDDDTVSIYHNNVLVVSKARLSQNPITYRIQVSSDKPYHELVMVAENLGSIPPNTSVMIVTGGGKKQEVFISSSEQKNAKVVIELNE